MKIQFQPTQRHTLFNFSIYESNFTHKLLLTNFSRYGDASWSAAREYLMRSSCMSRSLIDETRPRLYGAATEKILDSNNSNWPTNCSFRMGNSSNGANAIWKMPELKEELLSSCIRHPWQPQSRLCPTDLNPVTQMKEQMISSSRSTVPLDSNTAINLQECRNSLKRKGPDCKLDLDLSLKLTSSSNEERRRGLEDNEVVDSELSLSLYSPSSSNKHSRLKEGQDRHSKEHGRRASTLDLTI